MIFGCVYITKGCIVTPVSELEEARGLEKSKFDDDCVGGGDGCGRSSVNFLTGGRLGFKILF